MEFRFLEHFDEFTAQTRNFLVAYRWTDQHRPFSLLCLCACVYVLCLPYSVCALWSCTHAVHHLTIVCTASHTPIFHICISTCVYPAFLATYLSVRPCMSKYESWLLISISCKYTCTKDFVQTLLHLLPCQRIHCSGDSCKGLRNWREKKKCI